MLPDAGLFWQLSYVRKLTLPINYISKNRTKKEKKAAEDGATLQHIASTSILLISILSVDKCDVLQN